MPATEGRMTIPDQLRAELRDAMRARDRRRLDVIRQVETEVSRARSAPGFTGPVDDDLYRRVIAAYVKQMEKSLEEYRRAGERGADMVGKLEFEIAYLQPWLPSKLDEAATRTLVRREIESAGAKDPKHAGQVIGSVMRKHGEQVDGSLVNRLVREELAASQSS